MPQLPEADVLVIDAPSEGISAEALRAIIDYGPARIIYSSANLGAFARDARLLHKPGYRLKDVQPIDMQPANVSHSHHCSVVQLMQSAAFSGKTTVFPRTTLDRPACVWIMIATIKTATRRLGHVV